MLTQVSPTANLIDLIQGQSLDLEFFLYESDGETPRDLSLASSSSMNIRESSSGEILDTLTSANGRIQTVSNEQYNATASIALSSVSSVPVYELGYLDIQDHLTSNIWTLHWWADGGGSPEPTSGPTLVLAAGVAFGWKAVTRAIVDVINTGNTSEPGFSVRRSPTAHPSVTAETIQDQFDASSTDISLVLTSTTSGSAPNGATVEFSDSDDSFYFDGSLESGSTPPDLGYNVTLKWSAAESAAILADSARPTGLVHLIGDLFVTLSTGDVYTDRLEFKFTQTT
tara:strand:+ start:5506 stop:6357 length:852 start_codon:yes stop_codon:yes gene_type:complete